jgi:hypothetical protein
LRASSTNSPWSVCTAKGSTPIVNGLFQGLFA